MAQSIVKKISNPYEIFGTSGNTIVNIGNSTTSDATVTINGNLVVTGTEYVLHAINLAVTNSDIILNSRIPGSALAPAANASITVDRGISPNAALFWNETIQSWQLTNDGLNYYTIATSNSGYLTIVQNDPAPVLGGNLNTNGHTITSNTNVILSPTTNTQIESVIQLKELVSDPVANIAGYNLVYSKAPSSGGTGIYITNQSANHEELVSKRKAIVYSLIF